MLVLIAFFSVSFAEEASAIDSAREKYAEYFTCRDETRLAYEAAPVSVASLTDVIMETRACADVARVDYGHAHTRFGILLQEFDELKQGLDDQRNDEVRQQYAATSARNRVATSDDSFVKQEIERARATYAPKPVGESLEGQVSRTHADMIAQLHARDVAGAVMKDADGVNEKYSGILSGLYRLACNREIVLPDPIPDGACGEEMPRAAWVLDPAYSAPQIHLTPTRTNPYQ